MTNAFRPYGFSLCISTFLMVITMLHHPVGGDFNHLMRISTLAIISHSIAIGALPFFILGFLGMYFLYRTSIYSLFAFILVCLSQISLLMAGAVNGLILPLYIRQYKDADENFIVSLKPVLRYGYTINLVFDYVAIASLCAAICVWSMLVLKKGFLPRWIAWFGIALIAGILILLISKFSFTTVSGFTVFIFGLAGWVLAAGIQMTKIKI